MRPGTETPDATFVRNASGIRFVPEPPFDLVAECEQLLADMNRIGVLAYRDN